ncbi:putative ABC transport system ATP-binding protein [Desulfitispora alkaliphila]|uniref:ABC transporter ATP-binding protein n=1 Tax=Desulfitispora alkaliphila TaxID=622674 RepID=UPI003D1EBE4D
MIKYEGISVKFNNQYLFKGVNLTVSKGEKVLISGRSGIGKSVLFKMLMGFVQPDQGTVYLNHKPLSSVDIWEARKQIAYVSQDVDIGAGIVWDIIEDIFSLKANAHLSLSRSKLLELSKEFELKEEILAKDITHLSGGEKQRIAIIIAILLERSIFLLDEITAALDGELKNKVIRYFSEKPNLTALIISHDIGWRENENVKIFNLEEGI